MNEGDMLGADHHYFLPKRIQLNGGRKRRNEVLSTYGEINCFSICSNLSFEYEYVFE
jgi:hypothetical protein